MLDNNISWFGHCGKSFISFTSFNSNHSTLVLKNIKGSYELYFADDKNKAQKV